MLHKGVPKAASKKTLTIDCYYRLLSGSLVTFTTTITIVEKVSFAMPWCPSFTHLFEKSSSHTRIWQSFKIPQDPPKIIQDRSRSFKILQGPLRSFKILQDHSRSFRIRQELSNSSWSLKILQDPLKILSRSTQDPPKILSRSSQDPLKILPR